MEWQRKKVVFCLFCFFRKESFFVFCFHEEEGRGTDEEKCVDKVKAVSQTSVGGSELCYKRVLLD